MRKQCECKLPYVLNGSIDCERCGNMQGRFLPSINDSPLSVKTEYKGTEFVKGDLVEVIAKSYSCLVEIQNYIPNGWYHVKLPNGGYHDTQILGRKVFS